MRKGFQLFLFAACVLAGLPALAEDLSANPPLFLTSNPASSSCAPMSSSDAPVPALLTPQPESRVIVCGTCGDVACDFKRAYGSCTVLGWPGVCEPGPVCPGQTNVECYCQTN